MLTDGVEGEEARLGPFCKLSDVRLIKYISCDDTRSGRSVHKYRQKTLNHESAPNPS